MQSTIIRTKGTIEMIPKFDPVAQLCAASMNKTENSKNAKLKEVREIILDSMGNKRWRVNDLRDHVNSTHGTNFKRDTIRSHLNGLVNNCSVRKYSGTAHIFWRA